MFFKKLLQENQCFCFELRSIVFFKNGVGMDKMMLNLIEYILIRNGRSNIHFPENLPRIAGDDFCIQMLGYLNAKIRLSDPGGTSQDQ